MIYSIGQVEKLTGVKATVIKYWEQQIPGFAPEKNLGGHRVYNTRNIELIMRLKYLIEEKRFTVEGAKRQILEDIQYLDKNKQILQAISRTRETLMSLYKMVHKNKN